MGEGGAVGAGDTLGRVGKGAAVEGEAGRTEGAWVESEDTGGAEAALDAEKANLVEKVRNVGTAIAAFFGWIAQGLAGEFGGGGGEVHAQIIPTQSHSHSVYLLLPSGL